MFLCVQIHGLYLCTCVCVHIEAKGQLQVILLMSCPPCCWRQSHWPGACRWLARAGGTGGTRILLPASGALGLQVCASAPSLGAPVLRIPLGSLCSCNRHLSNRAHAPAPSTPSSSSSHVHGKKAGPKMALVPDALSAAAQRQRPLLRATRSCEGTQEGSC